MVPIRPEPDRINGKKKREKPPGEDVFRKAGKKKNTRWATSKKKEKREKEQNQSTKKLCWVNPEKKV